MGAALGRDDLGIAPGAKADFVMIDIAHPAMQPLYDPVRSMLYAAGERGVAYGSIQASSPTRNRSQHRVHRRADRLPRWKRPFRWRLKAAAGTTAAVTLFSVYLI
jgi:cytosine/adenosine deaminase-related metal-dependent hydrolase